MGTVTCIAELEMPGAKISQNGGAITVHDYQGKRYVTRYSVAKGVEEETHCETLLSWAS
jgi:hypothetical protein